MLSYLVQVWVLRGMFLPILLPSLLTRLRYVLFSIGNLSSLFTVVWPTCWKTFTVCNKQWTYAVIYLEVVGIIFGQIGVGLLGDG